MSKKTFHSVLGHGSQPNNPGRSLSPLLSSVLARASLFLTSLSGMDNNMPGMDMPAMMHNGSMSMMKMWFHVDLNDYLLFKPWLITNSKEMAAAFIGMFIVAALYEGLKILREHLLTKHSHRSYAPEHEYEAPNGSTGGAGDVRVRRNPVIRRLPMLSLAHLLQTMLHMLQVFLSYILMLVFMTYNVWLCLAVILGAGTGYFLFSWKRTVLLEDLTEHCH